MAKQRPPPRILVDAVAADAEAFRAAVRDVTPLAQTAATAGLSKPKPRGRLRKTAAFAAAAAADNLDEAMPLIGVEGTSAADAVTVDGALSFQRAGVRIQVMRRLRRGLYPIDDELDLQDRKSVV